MLLTNLPTLTITCKKTIIFLLHHLPSINWIKTAPVETENTRRKKCVRERERGKISQNDRLESKLLSCQGKEKHHYTEIEKHIVHAFQKIRNKFA